LNAYFLLPSSTPLNQPLPIHHTSFSLKAEKFCNVCSIWSKLEVIVFDEKMAFEINREDTVECINISYTFASFTNKPAIPMPVPIHMLVNSTFFFCLLHSLRPVTI